MKNSTRRIMANAIEISGGLIALLLFALLAWLFLICTPDQYSAEADLERAAWRHRGRRNEDKPRLRRRGEAAGVLREALLLRGG